MDSPRVAVVGAGAWGRNHVRVMASLGALAGVVEVAAGPREHLRERYPGLTVWSSLDQVLPYVDGVVVATPSPSHASLAARVLLAGKGVLVEKPMTLHVAEAEALAELAREGGPPLMVGHLLLYQSAISELKVALDKGLAGDVRRVHMERLNHGRVRDTENVLWSLAPHDVAVLLHLMGGEPVEIQATGASFLQEEVADDAHLELAWADGRSAHIHVSWYWPGKRRGLKVMGSKGMIEFDEATQALTLHRKHLAGGDGPDRLMPMDEGTTCLFEGQGEALVNEDKHFLDCLATGGRPLSDGRSGVQVIRVLEEADAQIQRALSWKEELT
jgi:predicted dehydrogenase